MTTQRLKARFSNPTIGKIWVEGFDSRSNFGRLRAGGLENTIFKKSNFILVNIDIFDYLDEHVPDNEFPVSVGGIVVVTTIRTRA